MFRKQSVMAKFACLATMQICLITAPSANAQQLIAPLITFNTDSEIFTDTTQAPRGTSSLGATLGAQRENAVKFAFSLIESELRIVQQIDVEFVRGDLNCGAVGVGTYNRSLNNGVDQIPNTVYPTALSNQLSRGDTSGPDNADVLVILNQNILDGNCPRAYSYNLRSNANTTVQSVDFVETVLHEVSHGLGFEVRPQGSELPFVYEQFLFAKDENRVYGQLSAQERDVAAGKVKNIVFAGPLTKQVASNQLTFQRSISSQGDGEQFDIPVIESLGARSVPVGQGISGEMVNLNFNTCQPEGDLRNKIVIMPSGCAREELGFGGPRFDGIQRAIRERASAIVIGAGATTFRFSILTRPSNIPVVSVLASDFVILNRVAANQSRALLNRNPPERSGVDEFGAPFVFTGPGIGAGTRVLHYDPSVNVSFRNQAIRTLQDPVVAGNGRVDLVRRSLGLNLPALIDLGWAARSCGNGRIDRLEQCDDGNANSGDGCEQNCLLPSN